MRRLIVILTLLSLGALCAEAQHYDRGYELNPSTPFVSKGAWVAGGSARYTQHVNENFNLMLIDGINSEGFNLSVNPKLLYMFKDNAGVGFKASYDRSMLDLNSAEISVSDISMSAKDCYQINHKFGAYAVYRNYIPLAGSKRIAMFADLLVGGSFKQGKAFYPGKEYVIGTYEERYALEIAVDPGIVAFISERLAVECNVGVFGVSYGWNHQIHNQVSSGNSDKTSAGFMVNLLSLGVGMYYYFL